MGYLRTRTEPEFEQTDTRFMEDAPAARLRAIDFIEPLNEFGINSWTYDSVKRAIDIVGSLTLMIAGLFPGLLIAAAIAITSKGDIFYRETRIGRNGVPFRIWKFRSMRTTAKNPSRRGKGPSAAALLYRRVHKSTHDPRITMVGHFLRRWSLDELPQVFNVLCGDMSLVGPRPIVAEELPYYGEYKSYYLAALPGLSGLWQVSGRSNLGFAVRARLDASYVKNWSLYRDLLILFGTLPAVITRDGAR